MYTEINLFQDIDDAIQKFHVNNGDVTHAIKVIDGLIEKNKGTIAEYVLTYVKGKLQAN